MFLANNVGMSFMFQLTYSEHMSFVIYPRSLRTVAHTELTDEYLTKNGMEIVVGNVHSESCQIVH